MDFREIMKTESLCVEEHSPECKGACPLHVDMRGLIGLLKKQDFEAATKLWQKQSFFPRLVAGVCDAPCEKACKRLAVEESVAINNLEKWLVANQGTILAAEPIVPYLSLKKKVAIIGGGLSSLAAAWHLYEKGFQITLFEAEQELCTELAGFKQISKEDIAGDLAVLLNTPIKYNLGCEVGKDISYEQILADYDGVFIGGKRHLPVKISADAIDVDTFQSLEQEKIFIGGSVLHQGEAYAIATYIAEGRRAAISLDRFLKNVSLTAGRRGEAPFKSSLYTVTKNEPTVPRVLTSAAEFDLATMLAEAQRCLNCHCLECVKQCKFMTKFEKYPQKYVREIANTINLLGGGLRSGRSLVLSCNLCGLCKELCPNAMPMPEVCLSGRQELYKKKELPEGFYDFPVRDMLFSNSDEFSLVRPQPGQTQSKYLFFPGCQMAASTPQYVQPVYEHLQKKLEGGVGLFLGCCGAPAHWSGRPQVYETTMAELLEKWEAMGKPIMIVGCTTCYQQFKMAKPEMEIKSVWEVFADFGLPYVPHDHEAPPKFVAIHDPCTARYNQDIQEYVREILIMTNYEVEELEFSKEKTRCCGYGGLVFYGNKEVALETIAQRVGESPLPYVAYCSVCRDYLVKAGKPTYHILDIIFGNDTEEAALKPGPNISEKETNRIKLKQSLLKNLWQEDFAIPATCKLLISDDLQELLEERLITHKNLQEVIEKAEASGEKLVVPASGNFIAHSHPALVTYWVEYSPEADGWRIYDAYSHRLRIIND